MAREQLRGFPHRPLPGLEGPQDKLRRARGREPFSIRGPIKRANARHIALHAHILAIDEPPAMERRLLHGGDKEAPVGTENGGEMRAFPSEPLGTRRWEDTNENQSCWYIGKRKSDGGVRELVED